MHVRVHKTQISPHPALGRCLGDLANGNAKKIQSATIGGFSADAGGRDAEFLRLTHITAFDLNGTLAREFNPTTGTGVYVFDGRCFNSYINNTGCIAVYEDCSNADVWVMDDTQGDGTPGELKFGPGNSCFYNPSLPSGFNSGYRDEIGCDAMVWNGRIEGAAGDGHIFLNNASSYLTIGDETEIDIVYGSNTHKVNVQDAYSLRISPGANFRGNTTGGDIIHIENLIRGYIPPLSNDQGESAAGDTLYIGLSDVAPAKPNRIFVPRPSAVQGTVTYPAGPWYSGLTFHDGWQRWRSGTTPIDGGTTTQLTNYNAGAGTRVRIGSYSVAADPGSDPRFQWVHGWDSGSGKQWLGVEELSGNAFELAWSTERIA